MIVTPRAPAIRPGIALALVALVAGTAGAEASTFFVVRHAERPAGPGGGPDPPLTAVGMRRAEELRDILRGSPIAAVYSTRTLRTWQTATPTAARSGVEITPYDDVTPAWLAGLKARHDGQDVLIVGHSDTVGDIVAGLGGTPGTPIGEQFDNLFVVAVEDGVVRTERRKYRVLEPIRRERFPGVANPKDLSAIAGGPSGSDLVIAGDEGSALQVLGKAAGGYEVRSTIALGGAGAAEADFEGIARHGPGTTYFVAGSHALRRKNIFRDEDKTATLSEIRKRFEKDSPDREKGRERLIRLEIDPATGEEVAGSRVEASLRDLIDEHPVLKPFGRLPATENGVDIEGIASDGERLYLGLRGPVLRFGFGLILVIKPGPPHEPDLRHLRMDGRGVRDLARVAGGFLVIAGPVGDTSLPHQLYHWDGKDGLPGVRGPADPPQGRVTLLGSIPAPPDAEPEGIVVLKDEAADASYEVMIIYDGIAGGSPTVFRVPKPSGS